MISTPTADDRLAIDDLRLPADRPVTLELHSADFLYTFAFPDLDRREIAIPDLVHTIDLPPAREGILRYRGDQLCGYRHDRLIGEIRVEPPRAFRDWRDTLPPADA